MLQGGCWHVNKPEVCHTELHLLPVCNQDTAAHALHVVRQTCWLE